MAFNLWISPDAQRRKGTTFKEMQEIFVHNITTKFIYEDIYSCNKNASISDVSKTMADKDFDVLGVVDQDKNVIGYVSKKDLGEIKDNSIENKFSCFGLKDIAADSTPMPQLLRILSERENCFIIKGNKVVGIVTRADINKPIVRIYIFGIISLLEMHLGYWINEYFKEEKLQNVINQKKINLSKNNNDGTLSLLERTNFHDKIEILKECPEFERKLKCKDVEQPLNDLFKAAKGVRNSLAHHHKSIKSDLTWDEFANTVENIESFLKKSEKIIEELVNPPAHPPAHFEKVSHPSMP